MIALIEIPNPPQRRRDFFAPSAREITLERSPLKGIMLCVLPPLVYSRLSGRGVRRRAIRTLRREGCTHYLSPGGRIDFLEAAGLIRPPESEEYFRMRADEACMALFRRLALPADKICVLINSSCAGIQENRLLAGFSDKSASLFLRADDGDAAAELADDFYYERGISLIAGKSMDVPSPCFIYSLGAHGWLRRSGALRRPDTVAYVAARKTGLPGVYADGFDVRLPGWLRRWRPPEISSGRFASMLYSASGNRRLLSLRITDFTCGGRPVYTSPSAFDIGT